MIPATVRYERPATVEAAVTALARYAGRARPLAGGQSLIPLLRMRRVAPDALVDLSGIPGLTAIRRTGPAAGEGPTAADGLTVSIGALATHHQVAASEHLKHLTLFADAAHDLADVQVRNRGTFAGALAHADPVGDWSAVALATRVTLHVTGASGVRTVPIDQFLSAPYEPDLRPDELITDMTVPAGTGYVSAYTKIANGALAYALAGAAVVAAVDAGRVRSVQVAATGVASTPCRLPTTEAVLIGGPLDRDRIAAAAAVARDCVTAIADHAASADYRLHLLAVACRRALTTVANRLDAQT